MTPRHGTLLDLLRSRTGSDDLLRVLLKAQADRERGSVEAVAGQTRVRVTALHGEAALSRGHGRSGGGR